MVMDIYYCDNYVECFVYLIRWTRRTGWDTASRPLSMPSTHPWRTPSSSLLEFCRYLSIFLSIYLSIHVSIYLSIYFSIIKCQRLLLPPGEQHPVPCGHPSRQLLWSRPSSIHELWCYRLGKTIPSIRDGNRTDLVQVIGHEITHGFDDQGRTFDSTGNLANWWERSTEENYLEKAQCIIWQYGNYTATAVNKTLNGVNTQVNN